MKKALVMVLGLVFMAVFSGMALAHCDTMNGPLIKEAKEAFEKKDLSLAVKWVKKPDEKEIKKVFEDALKAAAAGAEAKAVAERYFLENLVRVHRQGEGASYTGIKPEGAPVDEAVVLGDKALETGSVDALANKLSEHMTHELHKRFEKAAELKGKASKSPEDGRKYVEAYVSYIHFVENIHTIIKGSAAEAHGH